jgi:serine/threonine-protein kinase
MGVVVAAHHMQLERLVALKFMRDDAAQDAQAVGRFLREARAAVALSNEHVAKVLDVGTLESGAPYMVMEYLSGEDLDHVLRRDGPMPVPVAVDVMLQACEAIAEAHALGIVHRDLKPANLFATTRSDGSRLIKVLDFGISKAATAGGGVEAAALTSTGMVMGSPMYMSPEQVRSAKGVDARSDIWSLGVIFYELLAGVAPFVGETLGDMLVKITSEPPPPIQHARPDLHPELVATINQCLERSLEARVQSVADLAARLLPFATREAALSAERILRLAGRSSFSTTGGSHTTAARSAEAPAPPWATERPWLRSGQTEAKPPSRSFLPVLAGLGVVLFGAGGIAVGYWIHKQQPSAVTAGSSAPAATSGVGSLGTSLGVDAAAAALTPSSPSTAVTPLPLPTAASAAAPASDASTSTRLPSSSTPASRSRTPSTTRPEPRPEPRPAAQSASPGNHDYDHF